jgi:hypothetical protein
MCIRLKTHQHLSSTSVAEREVQSANEKAATNDATSIMPTVHPYETMAAETIRLHRRTEVDRTMIVTHLVRHDNTTVEAEVDHDNEVPRRIDHLAEADQVKKSSWKGLPRT